MKKNVREVDTNTTNPEESMRQLAYALGGLLLGLFIGHNRQEKSNKSTTSTPPQADYNPFVRYKFNCWLCSGETLFDALPHVTEIKKYDQDCKWCGMANRVEIKPICKV